MFADPGHNTNLNRHNTVPYVPKVLNSDLLLKHGNQQLRESAIRIIEYALKEAHPYNAAASQITEKRGILTIGNTVSIDLDKYEKIIVIGAGKASHGIAAYLEDLIGNRISDGLIIAKEGIQEKLRVLEMVTASHPIPNAEGYQAAQRILDMCRSLSHRTLVLALFTGGSSALFPYPADGVTLQEKSLVSQTLLSCGADITEINTIRKHLSKVKGGLLAQRIAPATIVNITVSDVVGDAWDYITDPTVPDTSTFRDAISVLDKYNLRTRLPSSVVRHIEDSAIETPKFFSHPVHNHLLVPSQAACTAAQEEASRLGYMVEGSERIIVGEAQEAAISFCHEILPIAEKARRFSYPVAVIAGGEKTVRCSDDQFGNGGPNQEFVLRCALELVNHDDILVTSIDSDGTDGPTDTAGAMIGGETLSRAKSKNINIKDCIDKHYSGPALRSLEDHIYMGHSGTNVNDLTIALIYPRS
jgi:glycerate-2-kinase